ncbi:MAG: GWxTD domain-containing protein [Ignavibacteriae bacterium]|nr:GWxTD domain-containing protein [Ignavibacteriota bacterium]
MKKGILTLVLLLALAFSLKAQVKDKTLTNLNAGKEYFYIEPLVFYPLDSAVGRLDLYVEIPLENISFKKVSTGDNYESSLSLTLQIKNSAGDQVISHTYDDKVTNTKTEQKNLAEKSVSSYKSYFLKPDSYKLFFILKDRNTNAEYTKETSFAVKNPVTDRVISSDIMLLSNYQLDSRGEKEITPVINGNVGTLDGFYIFAEVWNRDENEILNKQLNIKVIDEKEKTVFDSLINVNLKTGSNSVIEKLYTDKYNIGNLRLEVYDGTRKITERKFSCKWGDVPITLKDLDNAVNQLQYIAKSSELDYINNAKTSEEKLKRFMKFWKSVDPSPRTAKNELMIEYYNRIKIANERYSHYVEGWKTDMGMVFVINGSPSVIDRHPFEADSKPYEIWTYYDINRQYIFVDYTGFGDYRLTTPMYDDRNRIRY